MLRNLKQKLEQKLENRKIILEPKLEIYEDTIRDLTAFKENFNPKSDIIYYPSCGLDVSISKVFPDSKIIYLDGNKLLIDILKKEEYEAHEGLSQEFDLKEKADILILINPMNNTLKTLDNLKEGGFVVCDDYHGTASSLKNIENFKLSGITNRRGKIETNNLNESGYLYIFRKQ
ncbi:MAG: hypothetical protein WDK96_03655 [Candidatus Paceibacterota bacterium]|jgi:hypothetical protein